MVINTEKSDDFNTRNKLLSQKLLKQGYQYHKLHKTFSKFYTRYNDLISKFQVGLKSLVRQGLLEPKFYGDFVYKLKKIVGSNNFNFSAQFIKIISHYKKIGYNINVHVLQQTACLVVKPSSKISLLTVPRRYFFCGSFVLFMSCVYHAFTSVHCCLVVTCWERADLLFVEFNCIFVPFPGGILGQVWYLIVSIPDLCRLSFFE